MRPDGTPGLLIVPDGFREDRSLGWSVADWIETFLCHGPGDVQGEPYVLDDEFRALLVLAYGLSDAGRRLVFRAVLSRAKGRAKSELAGALCCGELKAPVRFDHWAKRGETSPWGYEYEKGEPVGKPIRSPFVRVLATEEGQSGNTYDNAAVMLDYAALKWPDLFGDIDVGRNAQTSTRIFMAGGGEIRPSTASDASKDGGKETFVVPDETHLYVLRTLRAMHATVARNLTKRKIAQPWMLETSTMFDPGEDSIARDAHRYARDIIAGKAKNYDLLFDHREGIVPKNWDDDEAMVDGMKVAYGPAAGWTDFVAKLAEIRDPKTLRSDSKRYYFNVATQTEKSALDLERWAEQARPGVPPPEGSRIGLGFDGSMSKDCTVLYGSHAGRLFPLGAWVRPAKAPKDWRIPRHEVRATVRQAFEFYDVGLMLCDLAYWQREIDEWADEYGEDRVLAFDTNQHITRMWQACDRFVTGVTEGTVTHADDPLLTAHIEAAARKKVRLADGEDDGRTRFVFVKADGDGATARKIDALVAAVLAYEADQTMPEPAPDLLTQIH